MIISSYGSNYSEKVKDFWWALYKDDKYVILPNSELLIKTHNNDEELFSKCLSQEINASKNGISRFMGYNSDLRWYGKKRYIFSKNTIIIFLDNADNIKGILSCAFDSFKFPDKDTMVCTPFFNIDGLSIEEYYEVLRFIETIVARYKIKEIVIQNIKDDNFKNFLLDSGFFVKHPVVIYGGSLEDILIHNAIKKGHNLDEENIKIRCLDLYSGKDIKMLYRYVLKHKDFLDGEIFYLKNIEHHKKLNEMFIIAEHKGEIVGNYGPFTVKKDIFERNRAFAGYFHVIPSYQKLGIGFTLWNKSIISMKEMGAGDRIFRTESDNIKAQKIYEGSGFKKIGLLYKAIKHF